MTRLSIIIPGYNTPVNFWRRCLKSVLVACGHNDEVICVDDGSDDPVKKEWLLSENDNNFTHVRLIRLEKNSGLPTARNEGIKLARGNFIAFVDSDDEVLPEVYDRSIDTIEKYKSDIAIFGVQPVWIANGLCKHDVIEEEDLGIMSAHELAKVFKACLFDYAWNKIYRKSFLDEKNLRFDPYARTGEDTIFNCHCVLAEARWCTVNFEGIIYYRYDGTMLSRFVPNIRDTHRRKLVARAECRASKPGLDDLLGGKIDISEDVLNKVEWLNMWKRQSPYSLAEKWRYLKSHPKLTSKNAVFEFGWQLIYSFLRKHFYIKPIRRWNIKRNYPHVEEWHKNNNKL